jgi:cell division protein FtsI (penicillin-binding protein 3)
LNIKSNILFRIYLIGGLCSLFGIAVLGKVYQIQTYKNGYWKSLSDSLTTNVFEIPAERGNIYSADDKLLATSVPYFNLHVDFASKAMKDEIFQSNVDSLAYYMYRFFHENSKEEYKRILIKARKKKQRYFSLINKADYTLLNDIKTWPLFREGKFKGGLIIETHQERKNPFGYLAQRTIGLIRENAQDIGLEAAYDSLLAGVQGKMLKQKIAGGEWIPLKREGQIEPKIGYDIVTTINLGLQDIAETTLFNALTEYQADFGCAVLMEVESGAIKAIANLGKNPNNEYTENYNYALALRNEPGSVFKVASYLALFDDGYVTPLDSINTNHASARFGDKTLTDDGHNSQYTFLTPAKALAISSNVAIAKWITRSYNENRDKFYDKLDQFGLTEKSKLDIQGEQAPLVKKTDKWSYMSLPWMAHGYEIKFTPLQILTFYNAIANNGNRMKPFLVQKVLDNGNIIREYKPQTTKQKICKQQAANWIKDCMLRVVEDPNGTGRGIFTPHYRIAGKTGTAKMSFGTQGYTNKNLSTFVGFFPADKPLYSCIVVIGGPQGALTTGGAISAPIFRTIADKIMTSNLKPNKAINQDSLIPNKSLPTIIASQNTIKDLNKKLNINFDLKEDWDYVVLKSDSVNNKSITQKEFSKKSIPNVIGLLLDDAIFLLENAGLKVSFTGKGKVINQSISAGMPINKGSLIQLYLN